MLKKTTQNPVSVQEEPQDTEVNILKAKIVELEKELANTKKVANMHAARAAKSDKHIYLMKGDAMHNGQMYKKGTEIKSEDIIKLFLESELLEIK